MKNTCNTCAHFNPGANWHEVTCANLVTVDGENPTPDDLCDCHETDAEDTFANWVCGQAGAAEREQVALSLKATRAAIRKAAG